MSKPYERRGDLIRRGDAIDAVLERVAKIGGPGWRWRMNDLATVLANVPAVPKDPHPVPYQKVPDVIMKAADSGFYGTMYGEHMRPGVDVVHIDPGEAHVGADGCLHFRWGFPGPCWNTYKREDYGQTWALTKEELVKEGDSDA